MSRIAAAIPPQAGVGLKPQHYREILETGPEIGFFEVHAENYMGAGGPPHAYLEAIRARYPVSLHGVALSIGGPSRLDRDHLARLKNLIARYEPGLFSEHLAWSTHDDVYLNDLLPVPYTRATLARVCDHVDEAQEVVGRRMLLENPSTYLAFAASEMSEIAFLTEVSRRTGCGLLLDVNNVYVSAVNHGFDPFDYLDRFPVERVGEIHLAGHAEDADDLGMPLLIDSHDRPVADVVWALYEHALARSGPVPTLVEWDDPVPEWGALAAERAAAQAILDRHAGRLRQGSDALAV